MEAFSDQHMRAQAFLAAYDDWWDERKEYAEHDGEPDGPTANEWHDSDDAAFELLHMAAKLIADTTP